MNSSSGSSSSNAADCRCLNPHLVHLSIMLPKTPHAKAWTCKRWLVWEKLKVIPNSSQAVLKAVPSYTPQMPEKKKTLTCAKMPHVFPPRLHSLATTDLKIYTGRSGQDIQLVSPKTKASEEQLFSFSLSLSRSLSFFLQCIWKENLAYVCKARAGVYSVPIKLFSSSTLLGDLALSVKSTISP